MKMCCAFVLINIGGVVMALANYGLISEKWSPTAQEYIKFLSRYGLNPVGVISKRTKQGYFLKIYADEDKYLDLALNNRTFIAEEGQLTELLEIIEKLMIILLFGNKNQELNTNIDEEYDDEY